jgi:hypothetical protein
MITPKLIRLFREMADLTAPECESACKVPHSCCSPEYCDMAEELAHKHGIPLAHTAHPTLKFMGVDANGKATGCIVDPHWRPLCTLHTCDVNGLGFKRGDDVWNNRYFKLRTAIDREASKSGM